MEVFNNLTQFCGTVGSALGKGFSEYIYQEALCVLLRQNNINYSKEVIIPVKFNNICVGNVRADIVLDELKTVIECKAIDGCLKPSHLPQIITYLVLNNYDFGLLINFNQNPSKDIIDFMTVTRSNDNSVFICIAHKKTLRISSSGMLLNDEEK
jgi:GxxExxY protein